MRQKAKVVDGSLNPGPPPLLFFSLYNAQKQKTNGEDMQTLLTWSDIRWTWGGGGVPNYKNVDNKPERDCFTNQAEYSQSCDHVGSRLVMEHSMMKSSTLFKSRPLPLYVHLMSTWHHSHDKCS